MIPGSVFEGAGHIRLTYACSRANIREGSRADRGGRIETEVIPKAVPLKSEAMFRLAMRHTSAAVPNIVRDSYERLEFFGDSVLGLVVAQYLYEHFPDVGPGDDVQGEILGRPGGSARGDRALV